MATTFTGNRAQSTFPVAGAGSAGDLKVAVGSYAIAANPTAGDIYELCKVPAGAVVVSGWVYGPDIDSNATETLDMDIGWKANADEVTDTDGFGNLGVWNGDATTDVKPEVSNLFPLGGVLRSAGPKRFTKETVIQLYCNTTAATFSAGTVTAIVQYFMDPNYSVS